MNKLLFFLFFLPAALQAQQPAHLVGTFRDTSVKLVRVQLYPFGPQQATTDTLLPVAEGRFSVRFFLKEPALFRLSAGNFQCDYRLLEPGDSIGLEEGASGLAPAGGKGAAKLRYQAAAEQQFAGWAQLPQRSPLQLQHEPFFRFLEGRKKEQLALLEQFKEALSPAAYRIFFTDIWSGVEAEKVKRIALLRSWPGKQQEAERLYGAWIFSSRWAITQDDTVAASPGFLNYCVQRAELDYTMLWNLYGGKYGFYNKYTLARSLCTGKVQDRVLAALLLAKLENVVDKGTEQALTDFLGGTAAPELKALVEKEYGRQKRAGAGLPARDFTLPDTQNNGVSLAQYRGKVVVLDFWFANCTPCRYLFGAMKPVTEHFRNQPGVVFLNISIDSRKEEWLKAVSRLGLQYAVNLYTDGKGESHPVVKDYGITGYPARFLIDKRGRFFSSNLPLPYSDNGQALVRLIEEALKQ
ncbi:TlpA disulfide reductase family protein [Paraflavisolibacter sp. H34]|uniref:TlpA family protein disulfide reductase n=1 Tax=Huijunlia imazamoxiresistens TaxID=3127457 RepID=UPI003018FB71